MAVEELLASVKGQSLSVVLPEGRDPRIVLAARRLKDEGIAVPVLLGQADWIRAAATAHGRRQSRWPLASGLRETDQRPFARGKRRRHRGRNCHRSDADRTVKSGPA